MDGEGDMNALGALFLILLSGAATAGSEAEKLKAGALSGDYQAQRNYAYILQHGDGVPQNLIEACAWRLVIISTQHAKVSSSDVDNVDTACRSPESTKAALARANTLLTMVPLKVRTIADDIAAFTDGACPGATCQDRFGTFGADYRRAVIGDVDAARTLAGCFENKCRKGPDFDLVRACVWSKRVTMSLGAAAGREDVARERRTCLFVDSPRTKAFIDQEIAAIGAMAASADAPLPPSGSKVRR